MPPAPHESRTRLLDAALSVVRAKGFNATRIEDICTAAGVSKGSFFHHFKSKEDLALAAVEHWDATTSELFAHAPYHQARDPLDRLLGYLEFRKSLLTGEPAQFTCFAGTIIQEAHTTHPAVVSACGKNVWDHAETLVADIAEAMQFHQVSGNWSAESLALHTQAVLQGAFILAKASGDAKVASQSIDHLSRYVESLFGQP